MNNLSPLDNRYKDITFPLLDYFSEFSFFRYRIIVELEYFRSLCKLNLKQINLESVEFIDIILNNYDENSYKKIKEYETEIKHDVKAIEYYLRYEFSNFGVSKYNSFIHFGLTSQDINNTAYSLSLKHCIENLYIPELNKIIDCLSLFSKEWNNITMISRTHGQAAVPTTFGKEFNVFKYRLNNQLEILNNVQYYGKFGGASGNLNAHKCAYPNIDWIQFGKTFIESLGLKRSEYTTQIDNYDNLSVVFDCLKRINSILIDMCQDMWLYISIDYLKQKINNKEVGSSTMPHKVNPINFENAEGNLKLADSLLEFFSRKLPVSRLQRDLTDSTVLRNTGVIFGHIFVSFNNILKGLNKLEINEHKITSDLNDNYIVITEGIQTILRKYNHEDAYEKLKEFSRKNKKINKSDIDVFIDDLNVSENIKEELKTITITNYIGYA